MAIKANSRSPSASHPLRHHTAAQPPHAEHRKQREKQGGGATTPPGPPRAPEQRRSPPPPSLPHPRDGLHGTAPRIFCTAPALHCNASHHPHHPWYVHGSRLRAPPNRALAPWPPSQARSKHHLALPVPCFAPTRRAQHTPGVGSKSRPCRTSTRPERERRARTPTGTPPVAGTNTPGGEPKCRLSRASRSPRTHAAYAPRATRRTRPSRHARGRGRREHEHPRRTPRSGLGAILENPGTRPASSPRPGTHRARTISWKKAREYRGRGTAARPPWPASPRRGAPRFAAVCKVRERAATRVAQ